MYLPKPFGTTLFLGGKWLAGGGGLVALLQVGSISKKVSENFLTAELALCMSLQ